jgi:predicted nucleic acid-binding protein
VNEDVVCNTGPLIALASLARLDLLRSRFRRVLIPRADDAIIEWASRALTG